MTTTSLAPEATVLNRAARQWRGADARAEAVERLLAEEAPVGISYDGTPHAVLMATPADLEDLAVGFTLTERIADFADIAGIDIAPHAIGFSVNIALSPRGRKGRLAARVRTMEGRSSCGLCGVQRLSAAVRPLSPVTDGLRLRRGALQSALDALDAEQILGRATRATHAAAWADAAGGILMVREDVGRHNALDKLIGAGLRRGLSPREGFAVITSRCSYEMVEKAAIAGFPVLVAISAPTALAIRKAEEADMTLVALARADGHTVFTGAHRIVDPGGA